MKFLFAFFTLLSFLLVVSCSHSGNLKEPAPARFSAPVQVAPDYYYRSGPTYPHPTYDDYDRHYVYPHNNPVDDSNGNEYYSPYYYQQSQKVVESHELKAAKKEMEEEREEELHNTFLDESH